jgi:hypothetical protein
MDGSANGGFYAPPPQMINQPPRIFGNLNANGSPIPAQLTGPPVFSQDDYDDGHDQGDPKRRRIARVYMHSTHKSGVAQS